jgi:DNA-binding transcriptional MerR regulator
MSDKFISLNEAATELTVSANTLKRWAKDFEQFLSPSTASNGVRRFTTDDVSLLRRVKSQLSDGLSTDEVTEMFHAEGLGEGGSSSESTALATREAPGTQAAGFVVLTDTLRAMIENQQSIQNSLQVNRNLQGVIIQDNFNLKEENMKLRERMQRVEQELEDLRKRDMDNRVVLEQRLAQLEREARKSILNKLF